ncbi:YafY family protein [Lutibacter sp.]|uniref:helix-turn-helix transcriptional regulator n=1 Tax=Lutibacter sp. TaxID=1925666 RepID=UPI002732A840|nr:WYL domain-containing protein [Lutibacter sp.]MDP3312328.1 WYL domain-containing protein [Lutibacter sp.]
MSTNKHAIIRYQTLDKCFRNSGRNYAIEDLVVECNKAIYEYSGINDGVKKRQIYEDIRFMESEQGWNIDLAKNKEGRRVFYKYENPKFSISNQPLNETEANQLREALLTLDRFKGLPQYNWINELNTRLEASFNLKQKSDVIISFEENEYLKGLEYIPELYNAILYKKVLNINYKNFKTEISTNIIINPYYLKQFNMRWFLFGKSEKYKIITNLALDRIESIEVSAQDYVATGIDFNEYFDDVIGVTIPSDKIENIVLKIDNSLIPYITTKPLHGSQKIKETCSEFEVHLKLIPNYELEMLILSFGEKIQVLEPTNLVEKLKKRIHKMKNNY